MLMAEQSFNYDVTGSGGFEALARAGRPLRVFRVHLQSARRRRRRLRAPCRSARAMSVARSLVTSDVMLAPLDACGLSALEWDLLIRQGRRSNLLAELGWRLALRGVRTSSQCAGMHLASAMQLVAQQDVAMRHEVALVARRLQAVQVRVTFLKGAGYLMAGLPLARGRVFSDVDILVPKAQFHAVETALRVARLASVGPRRLRPALLPSVDARTAPHDPCQAWHNDRRASHDTSRDGPRAGRYAGRCWRPSCPLSGRGRRVRAAAGRHAAAQRHPPVSRG